jgi:hypothetical protein
MMKILREWPRGTIAACLVLMAVVSGAREAAARDSVDRLAEALLLFEQNVTWRSVAPEWAGQRDGWIEAVQDAATPAEVAAQVVALETSMRWRSVEESWRDRRDGWIGEMQSAESARDVARGLLELERATRWSAVAAEWRGLRERWIARLESVR